MKNRFIAPLFIVILTFFGLVSCSDSINDNRSQGQVSITFPVQELYNAISAREATDSLINMELNVTLYVNDKVFEEKKERVSDKFEEKEFVFRKIPLNSIVYATASVISITKTEDITQSSIMMTGESKKVTVTSNTKLLEIQLKWYENNGNEVLSDLYLEFYVKDSIEEKEDQLLKTIKTRFAFNYEKLLINPELLNDNDEFLAAFLWEEFDLTCAGYDSVEEVITDGTAPDSELVKENDNLYLKSYLIKVNDEAQGQTFSGNAGEDEYFLTLYNNNTYKISDAKGEAFLKGSW